MVSEVLITELKTAAYNPRIELEPGMKDYEYLKKSIETFGNIEPIVWNKRTGNVVGGHQRLRVLKDLGRETATCSVVDMSEEEEKLLNIALNKIKGQWDYDKLSDLLEGFDFELSTLSGFAPEEIAILLASDEDIEEDDDYDFSEYFSEEEADQYTNWVVTLVFDCNDSARDWVAKEGLDVKIKENSQTTVIRIDEQEE